MRDGLSYSIAQNNRRDWFSLEQVSRLGPDALLGTDLGEVVENGKRVSNVKLFLRSGYHLETVRGDRLYEWHNPIYKFYTYRITSSADDGYYIGRHRTSLASSDEMALDGYLGSGGAKYKHWVEKVGKSSLRKEVLAVYETWGEVVKAEEKLIGELPKTDVHCKNSMIGGTGLSSYLPDYKVEICEIHGETLFRGGCHKCAVKKSKKEQECATHGLTLHYGGSCYKCLSSQKFKTAVCSIHGETTFNGPSCARCLSAATFSLKDCEVHGRVKHQGENCSTCKAEAIVSLKECELHGETNHVGSNCKKCLSDKAISTRECVNHGLTIFKGDSCCKCSTAKTWTTETCPHHGETKHRAGKCEKCSKAENPPTLKTCEQHGETKHSNDQCLKCKNQSLITVKDCPTHGETKFTGDTCAKCFVRKIWTVEECSVHGETKHRSGKCERCARKAQWALRKAKEAAQAAELNA